MSSSAPRALMGVMVTENTSASPPIGESLFCRRLTLAGTRHDMTVYVFTSDGIGSPDHTIEGYRFTPDGWVQGTFRVPDIIYDRVSYRSSRHRGSTREKLAALAEGRRKFLYLARGLSGKWNVYQALKRAPALTPHLPETVRYKGTASLIHWLSRHGGHAFLKPHSGTHGKMTLHIRQAEDSRGLTLIGRDPNNKLIHKHFEDRAEGAAWVERFTGDRAYIMQPYLELTSSDDRPFDIRVLVQKNESGRWSFTGMAVRQGEKNALTSNLHGGGTALEPVGYLTQEFGETMAQEAISTIRRLSSQIPDQLEGSFGRLAELGIDFGVDRQGKVWIIEVNSKPGRSVFFQIGDQKSARKSVENPIAYARYLWLRQLRRINS
ncbi:YheC/YheD family protein [Paenibacillus sp. J22TS3]|uniref:YheC/YheD family endospore coat-associated protein n=1 Tax=Paenibacillus sp. J22TS3 TaxID=2807192 RepID=UPI001B20E1A7|nr:YheC/YheD family protein [Paenibacillus sp. J22TS3]GIP20922.1 endospore coat-associated protein YheC [Paenibacillus sp. J22TS3]